jgi:hypothetical protein
MQRCLRTPRHETILLFELPSLGHSEKMNCCGPYPTHVKLQYVHTLKYTLELSHSVFDILTLDPWSKPLRNRMASRSPSSFLVQAACYTHNLYLRENLCRYSPKITLPIDVDCQGMAPNSQSTPDRKQLIWASAWGLGKAIEPVLRLHHTIPYHSSSGGSHHTAWNS